MMLTTGLHIDETTEIRIKRFQYDGNQCQTLCFDKQELADYAEVSIHADRDQLRAIRDLIDNFLKEAE